MERLPKFLLSILLLTVIISSLSLPASAPNGIAKIVVEPRTINLTVSRTFTIDIWIIDLHSNFMQEFDFTITWDPTLMEYVSHNNHVMTNDPNWVIDAETLDPLLGTYRLNAEMEAQPSMKTFHGSHSLSIA